MVAALKAFTDRLPAVICRVKDGVIEVLSQ